MEKPTSGTGNYNQGRTREQMRSAFLKSQHEDHKLKQLHVDSPISVILLTKRIVIVVTKHITLRLFEDHQLIFQA